MSDDDLLDLLRYEMAGFSERNFFGGVVIEGDNPFMFKDEWKPKQVIPCTCGVDHVGVGKHSKWCDKGEDYE